MSFLNKLTGLFKGKTVVKVEVLAPQKQAKQSQIKPIKKIEVNRHQLAEAQAQAREIIIEAKDQAIKIKQEAQSELERKTKSLDEEEKKLYQAQADVDRKLGQLEERERYQEKMQNQLDQKLNEIEKVKVDQLEKLEKIASLTRKEARDLLIDATEKKLKSDLGRIVKEYEDKAKSEAEEKSRQIIVDAMYHGATNYVSEFSISMVNIDSEDIKGRVIGKEGRNIRAFEKATGVDVDLDEENMIRLSCFDPVRREVARVALETLIKDGRIQPSRIEEVVEKTERDIEKIMAKTGEDLCHRVKVYNLPQEIVDTLGRFKYRFSHGQSLVNHTLEVTQIGVALAQEIGANVNIVRLGCLLHDIGKVITDKEGTHIQLGVELLKKHKIPQGVVNSVAQHHEDEEFSSIESVIVYIADAISGARPGARYDDYEGFVKRMHELEDVATSFEGVNRAYAIQAGREVRVIVDPKERNDDSAYKLAGDIRDKIKKELTYPGAVKVTVIREIRYNEIAN